MIILLLNYYDGLIERPGARLAFATKVIAVFVTVRPRYKHAESAVQFSLVVSCLSFSAVRLNWQVKVALLR